MKTGKWPKIFPPLNNEQKIISDDFMKHWHEVLASHARYGMIEQFNHRYILKTSGTRFTTTLEIGAGLGEHLAYEKLSLEQKKHYHALELRESMAQQIRQRFPDIQVLTADCQKSLPFAEGYFDRIVAIHVLEHLPDLPAAIKEMHRVCNKTSGCLHIVIPCEGGLLYTLARKMSAQRIFEKRYNQSYRWYIEREHINVPEEIIEEVNKFFNIEKKRFFPFYLSSVNLNLCIGMSCWPKP